MADATIGRVTPAFIDLLAGGPDEMSIPALVVLSRQHAYDVSRAVWGEVEPELAGLREQLMAPAVEQAVPQNTRRDVLEQIDELIQRARIDICKGIEARARADQQALLQALEDFTDAGGLTAVSDEVNRSTRTISTITLKAPRKTWRAIVGSEPTVSQAPDQQWLELWGGSSSLPGIAVVDRVREAGPSLTHQRATLGLPPAPRSGGAGVFDLGVIDDPVWREHDAFGRTELHGPVTFFSSLDPELADPTDHGTAVAGIVVSRLPELTGLSPGTSVVVYEAAGDEVPKTLAALDSVLCGPGAGIADVINLSWHFDDQRSQDDRRVGGRAFDIAQDAYRVLVTIAAGNGGSFGSQRRLWHPAPSYNGLTVANLIDWDNEDVKDDEVADKSSGGPTWCGRRKPDLAAPGWNTRAPALGAGNDRRLTKDFQDTSAAAPHVAAAALLVADAGAFDPLAMKAVVLNSVRDRSAASPTGADSHWSPFGGWGDLDIGAALEAVRHHYLDRFVESGPRSHSYETTLEVGDRVTLVWNVHDGACCGASDIGGMSCAPESLESGCELVAPEEGSAGPRLTDLDLRVLDRSTGLEVVASLSRSDTVEQVTVPSAGPVVIEVERRGGFPDCVAEERYALAASAPLKRRMSAATDEVDGNSARSTSSERGGGQGSGGLVSSPLHQPSAQ